MTLADRIVIMLSYQEPYSRPSGRVEQIGTPAKFTKTQLTSSLQDLSEVQYELHQCEIGYYGEIVSDGFQFESSRRSTKALQKRYEGKELIDSRPEDVNAEPAFLKHSQNQLLKQRPRIRIAWSVNLTFTAVGKDEFVIKGMLVTTCKQVQQLNLDLTEQHTSFDVETKNSLLSK